MNAHDRRRVRRLVEAPDGVVLALELPTGTILHPGQLLHHDAEAAYVVAAADEDVLVVGPRDIGGSGARRASHRQHASRHSRRGRRDRRAGRRCARTSESAKIGAPVERARRPFPRPRARGTRPLMQRSPAASAPAAVRLAVSGRRLCAFRRPRNVRAGGRLARRAPRADREPSRARLGPRANSRPPVSPGRRGGRPGGRSRRHRAMRAAAFKVVPAVRDASVRLGSRTLALLRRLHPSIARARSEAASPRGRRRRRRATPAICRCASCSWRTGTACSRARSPPRRGACRSSPAQAQALIVELQPQLASGG